MVLAAHGYNGEAETQSLDAIHGIVLSMTLLPTLGHLLLIPIVSRYKLNNQRCLEIRTELDQQSETATS